MTANGGESARGLRTLGGAEAPPGLAFDLQTVARLPPSVRDDFWELLEPNLKAEVGDDADAHVAGFCRRHGVLASDLVPAVRATRTLFRTAALRDVGVADVAADLGIVLVHHPEVAQLLGALYGRALPRIRLEQILGTVGDFGAALEDVTVRLDQVAVSRHAPDLQLPIPLLTLRYRDAGEERRITLQLPPLALAKLKQAMEALVE